MSLAFIKNFQLCNYDHEYMNTALDFDQQKQPNIVYVKIDDILKKLKVVKKGTIFRFDENGHVITGFKNIKILHDGQLISINLVNYESLTTTKLRYEVNMNPTHKFLYSFNLCDCKMTDEQIMHNNKQMSLARQNNRIDYIYHNCDYCTMGPVEYPHATYCTECGKCSCDRHSKISNFL